MNKSNIIKKWVCVKQNDNILIIDIANKYSKQNNLELINLNLLDDISKCNYWFLCKKSGKLFFLNIINSKYNPDIINILSQKINRDSFTEIIFDLDKDTNTITNKTIDNINKSPRCIRYEQLSLLKNNVNIKTAINMISATSIRNYMLNDPLVDYLKEYNISSHTLDKPDSKKRKSNDISDLSSNIPISKKCKSSNIFSEYIMNSGIIFEDELIKLLEPNHTIVKVADFTESRQIKKFNETISLMKQGIPIIYQGVLHNNENNTYGLPDLIVRSDYINKLMNYEVIDSEESVLPSLLLGTKFHYKVIDIKHSTIPLRSDGIHVLNSENMPAYKGQLYIYTMALNKIQGIKINKSFIWGKKYSYESHKIKYSITNFLNKLAIINFDTIDFEYIEKTQNGINWIKTLRKDGTKWSLFPIPCRNELFPNMKNNMDEKWHSIKNEISNNINEITQVWNCGYKIRQLAHSNKIYKWTDPRFTSKMLKINNGKKGPIIDKILSINRQNKDIFRPKKIKYERTDWSNPNIDTLEVYLDFETLNTNLDSAINDGNISNNNHQCLFMIGLGYEKNKKWVFKNFIMNDISNKSEKTMFNEFIEYINKILLLENKKFCKMYHWTCAEVISYNNFKDRYLDLNINDSHISFYDLNKIFVKEPITIKDALNYSLKTVAKALKKHNLIESTWDTSGQCSNGLNAMIIAYNLYKSHLLKNNKSICDETIMKEIAYYNEIDCKVLWEIHNLLKTKY